MKRLAILVLTLALCAAAIFAAPAKAAQTVHSVQISSYPNEVWCDLSVWDPSIF